jgi:hypothetical protein
MRLTRSWPKLVFTIIPSLIVAGAGAALTYEHLQSDAGKAIRLVKESSSRKENFTIQQYLYTTVYHRQDRGESIQIGGWRARALDSRALIEVDFVFTDSEGEHVATWLADVKRGLVTAQNEAAKDLSWH